MNDFWNTASLSEMHIELSSYCNAACPGCPRYFVGSTIVKPDLELAQISIDQFKEWFNPDIIKQLKSIMFCGTIGDPMMAKDVNKILDYIFENNPNINVRLHTNGGIRSESNWSHLGLISKRFDHRLQIVFSIDGLEDTNHLYRRNVDWHTLMRNVKAYIGAGGYALWDYLIFKHNENQLEEAENFSKELGFKEFCKKRALGFDAWDGSGNLWRKAVLNKEGLFDYWIDPPINTEYRNNTTNQSVIEPDVINDVSSMADPIVYKKVMTDPHQEVIKFYDGKNFEKKPIDFTVSNNKNISCKSKKWNGLKEIFVSSTGHVYPCCYVGTIANMTTTSIDYVQFQKKFKDHGKDYFDLKQYSLKEIFDNNHLNLLYANSWDKKDDDKLIYCANTCGENNELDRIRMEGRDDGRRPVSKSGPLSSR